MSTSNQKQTRLNVVQWRPVALAKRQLHNEIGSGAAVVDITAWRAKRRLASVCMPNLPIKPQLKCYRGLKEGLHRKLEQRNRVAYLVTNHINNLIVNNPSKTQEYLFDAIAADLGLTADEVRAAITEGGYEGIRVHVTDEDRQALVPYIGLKRASAKAQGAK